MLAATAIMVVGICTTALASQLYGYRLGGVMVLPLLVVYTFREPLSPVVFAAATAAAWGALWLLREYTLNYGRRVFLAAVVTGALASVATAAALTAALPTDVTYYNAEVVGSIFPGVAAYNLMRVDDEHRRADLLWTIASYVFLVVVGLVAVRALAPAGATTPPVLLLPTSEAVDWLGLDPVGDPTPTLVQDWLALTLLLVDVAVYEVVRARYDVRLAGVILVPLLAMFSVRFGGAVVVYALGATAVFFAVSLVHWTTLLYGRNLLAVALITGVLFAAAIGVAVPVGAPGITLFFVGLFTGIGSYNLHRVAPKTRAASIRVSAGLFVVFYGVLLALAPLSETAFAQPLTVVHVALALVVLGFAAQSVSHLERETPDGRAFARNSVFAEVTGADADVSDSPLAARED